MQVCRRSHIRKNYTMPTINGARLTDHYGKQSWRVSPNNIYGWHYGMDIAGLKPGDRPDVVAVTDGVVTSVAIGGIPYRNGRHVTVKHGDGSATVYNHVGQPYVRKGQSVSRGARLAPMSNSGTQHVHLHLEWWRDVYDHNSHFNPLDRLGDYGWDFSSGKLVDEYTPNDWFDMRTDKEIQNILLGARIPVERSGKVKDITLAQSLINSDNNDNRFLTMLNEMDTRITSLENEIKVMGSK